MPAPNNGASPIFFLSQRISFTRLALLETIAGALSPLGVSPKSTSPSSRPVNPEQMNRSPTQALPLRKVRNLLLSLLLTATLTMLPAGRTALAQANYEPYAITTLAGSAGGVGSADGTGSAARFYDPVGVAVDGAGNVYVADSNNQTI